jgi:DNA-binding NtrC family response regulator
VKPGTILVAEDDRPQREILVKILASEGYEVEQASQGAEAMAKAEAENFDLVLMDLKMPDTQGISLLDDLLRMDSQLSVVIMTGHGTVETAVAAMKRGAYDYLAKPLEKDDLLLTVKRGVERRWLLSENLLLRQEVEGKFRPANIVGSSPKMQVIFEIVDKVSRSTATVLIFGESGTGKELIARAIHYRSPRKERPFFAINCAAFPESLLESELFGYEKGAFTGAQARKVGIFEAASGSSLFLDEVGDLSPATQAKVLRVLQEKEIKRVGGVESIPVDVRILAATNKDLAAEVRKGAFREDLYYRLNVIPIVLPPLRERAEDIPSLIEHFTKKYGPTRRFSPEAMKRLIDLPWTGNVRELESVIERAMVLSEKEVIEPEDLPMNAALPVLGEMKPEIPAGGIDFEVWERALLVEALRKSDGVVAKAARLLGMSYRTFQYRMEKFGIGQGREQS